MQVAYAVLKKAPTAQQSSEVIEVNIYTFLPNNIIYPFCLVHLECGLCQIMDLNIINKTFILNKYFVKRLHQKTLVFSDKSVTKYQIFIKNKGVINYGGLIILYKISYGVTFFSILNIKLQIAILTQYNTILLL